MICKIASCDEIVYMLRVQSAWTFIKIEDKKWIFWNNTIAPSKSKAIYMQELLLAYNIQSWLLDGYDRPVANLKLIK